MAELELVSAKARARADSEIVPDSWWKVIPAALWIPVETDVFVLLWVGIQILVAVARISVPSGVHVGYLGHLGGTAVGSVFWVVYRSLKPPAAFEE